MCFFLGEKGQEAELVEVCFLAKGRGRMTKSSIYQSEMAYVATILFTIVLITVTALGIPTLKVYGDSRASNIADFGSAPREYAAALKMEKDKTNDFTAAPPMFKPPTLIPNVEAAQMKDSKTRKTLEELQREWNSMEKKWGDLKPVTKAEPLLVKPTRLPAEKMTVKGVGYVNSSIDDPLLVNEVPDCEGVCLPAFLGLGRAGFNYIQELSKSFSDKPSSHPEALAAWWALPTALKMNFPRFTVETSADYDIRTNANFQFSTLVHLVRYPLAHLASLEYAFNRGGKLESSVYAANDAASYRYAAEIAGIENVEKFMGKPRKERALILLVEWNEKVEAIAHYRQRAENVDLGALTTAMHIDTPKSISHTPMMTRGLLCKTWEEVKEYAPEGYYERLMDMTIRYGYTPTDEYECTKRKSKPQQTEESTQTKPQPEVESKTETLEETSVATKRQRTSPQL